MNAERIAQPTPYAERPSANLFRPFDPDYLDIHLDVLAMLTDAEMRFDEPEDPDYDFDWEMDCQDARDIEQLLDLAGCLDAEVES